MKERLYRHNFTGAQHQLVGLQPDLGAGEPGALGSSATLSARIENQSGQPELVV